MHSKDPIYVHPLQVALFGHAVQQYGITTDDLVGHAKEEHQSKVKEIKFLSNHHHILTLGAVLKKELAPWLEANKLEIRTVYEVEGLSRARIDLVQTGYVPVEGVDVVVRHVDVSMFVYPEGDSSAISVPIDSKEDKKPEDEKKLTNKIVLHTAANIPVIYSQDGTSWTKHYQEEPPQLQFPGMTNRPLGLMFFQVAEFLRYGIVAVEHKF